LITVWGKLADLINDLNEKAGRDGWSQTGLWLADKLVSLPCRRIEYTVFARSLLEPLPVVEPRLPITLRPASQADLAKFEGLVPSWELDYFGRRLAHGRHCFLALNGDNLAAYCWATTQVEFDVDNLEMQLQPGDVYVDDAFTIPSYRRQGIQTVVHLYRLRYMRDLGYQKSVLVVQTTNIASQRLVRKLGYQNVDHLSFRRIFLTRVYHYHRGD